MLTLMRKTLRRSKIFAQTRSISSKILLITVSILTFIHKFFDTLPSGVRSLTPLPLSVDWLSDWLLTKIIWREKSNNVTVEKSGKHHLNQMNMMNVTSSKSCSHQWYCNWLIPIWCDGQTLHLCDILSPNPKLQSTHEKISDKPRLRNSLWNTWLVFFKSQGHEKLRYSHRL